MSIAPGTRIGPYEIAGRIGAGGMGEVYRATDTNLARQVAIKVLPEAVAADDERLARFDREARTLAALNHPGIAQIYGVEKQHGQTALVMELVEGPTLADRIAKGALPVDEALSTARQIAEALEAAHEQGIVHRDLKPQNIKLRPDGTVKVLDFGLAKAMEPAASASLSASMSPTITTPAMTQMGMILGTAAYMSPEQARGKPVDRRADVWAFGAVLFEMLTGARAFAGEDVTETLASVVRSQPPWEALPDTLSPSVRVFLRRCLHKDAKQRVGDIHDVRLALDGAFETAVAGTDSNSRLTVSRQLLLVGLTAAVVGAVAIGTGVWHRTDPQRLKRFGIITPSEGPPGSPVYSDVAVSPDGARIVYSSGDGAASRLYVRPIDQLETAILPGAAPAVNPFFSPDGEQIGFLDTTQGALKRVSVLGGRPRTIVEQPDDGLGGTAGASWGPDGTVVFGRQRSGLWSVSAIGGEPQPLTVVSREDGVAGHYWPKVLPNGKGVLFTVWSGSAAESHIAVASLETGTVIDLLPRGSHPRYASTGHLIYGADGALWAVAFDQDRFAVTGNPVRVVEGVLTKSTGAADFALADDGSLVYLEGSAEEDGERPLIWVDQLGRETPLTVPAAAYSRPRVSPEGTRVAAEVRGSGRSSIWVADTASRTLSRITPPEVDAVSPVWTLDGQHVVFASVLDGQWGFSRSSTDRTGQVERLVAVEGASGLRPGNWSPDGKHLVFDLLRSGGKVDVGVLSLEGGVSWRPLLQTEANEFGAAISPNGRWVAYVSNETGRQEIYLQRFPEGGQRQIVSTDGGIDPVWAPDGRALYFLGTRGGGGPVEVVAVTVSPGVPPVAKGPKMLFAYDRYARPAGGGRFYDLAQDGQRFLMLPRGAVPPRLTVVQNWFEELKRLVPTD